MTSAFRSLTPESVAAAEARIADENARVQSGPNRKRAKIFSLFGVRDRSKKPDPTFEEGMTLPKQMAKDFPKELTATPIEDIDQHYENRKTFVAISTQKNIFRFSTENALWLLSPFSPLRRLCIYVLVHPNFSFIVTAAIIVNFILMTLPNSATTEDMEYAIIVIYTVEFFVRTLARGFLLSEFTYLRDPWNCLDFVVICSGYFSMLVYMGNISALRMFRILKSLKYSTAVKGFQIAVRAVFASLNKLRELAVFTSFVLLIFALLGMQLYMGVLTQRCILIPNGGLEVMDTKNEAFKVYASNILHQGEPCSMHTDICPSNYSCVQGFGNNPDYGYTNFDTFGYAMLSSFRLMNQDFWEDIHQLVLITTGFSNTIYFIMAIWGMFSLLIYILAVVCVTYEKEQQFDKKQVKGTKPKSDEEVTDSRVTTLNSHNVDSSTQHNQERSEEEEAPTFWQTCKTRCGKLTDTFCIWQCCTPWIKFQQFSSKILFHPVTDIIIAVLIVCSTLVMAMNHYNMSSGFQSFMIHANCCFVVIFAVELFLKIIVLSPKYFFQDVWNVADFFIIIISLVDICMVQRTTVIVLRTFWLLKIFKNCKSCPTLNTCITTVGNLLNDFANVGSVMVIILMTFAAVGMQLFGKKYIENKHMFYKEDVPRWHFADFLHSFMLVFRALCGEWIESMWDCMLVSGWTCIPFFVVVVIICKFVVANLFVAVILHGFYEAYISENPEMTDADDNEEAFHHISRDDQTKLHTPLMILGENGTNRISDQNGVDESAITTSVDLGNSVDNETALQDVTCQSKLNAETDDIVDADKFRITAEFHAGGSKWNNLRRNCYFLSENKYYEMIVTAVIIASSVCLVLEDVYLAARPALRTVLEYLYYLFVLLFLVEMIIKLMAVGFKKYFKNAYCCLDFVIVLVCVVDIPAMNFGGLSLFHLFRALIPLKVISHIQGTKVVLNAFSRTLPTLCAVTVVGFIIWLVFAIVGVELFSGKFHYCSAIGEDGDSERVNTSLVYHRDDCFAQNMTWFAKEIHFDNIMSAFLSLLQVATMKGWIDIMANAVDTTGENLQPEYEASIYMYMYFVSFVIFGSFLALNLYLGALVYSFNKQKEKAGGYLEILMTEGQKKYYSFVNRMIGQQPIKTTLRPTLRARSAIFDLVSDTKFDCVIKLILGLYVVVLVLEHFQMEETFEIVLDLLRDIIIAIFIVECGLKIFAFGRRYFNDAWNVFEFVVVVLAIIGIILKNLVGKYSLSLALVAIFKVGLVLRLAKGVQSMRGPLFALTLSLPALFNICLLYFVILLVYALFGMFLFMNVKHTRSTGEYFNFETVGQSLIMLIEVSTLAGWDGMLIPLMNMYDCYAGDVESDLKSDCGNKTLGLIYIVSFIIISLFFYINLYVAVALESYRHVRKVMKKYISVNE